MDKNNMDKVVEYTLFDRKKDWKIVYCEKDEDLDNVMKNIIGLEFVKVFNPESYNVKYSEPIKNLDSHYYIMFNPENKVNFIYQLGSKASDVSGNIIPHTYKIRKIGMLLD